MKTFSLTIAGFISIASTRLLSVSSTQICFNPSEDTYPNNAAGSVSSDLNMIFSNALYTPQHRITKIDYCWSNSTNSNGQLNGLRLTLGIPAKVGSEFVLN